jgi:hypothetical protein
MSASITVVPHWRASVVVNVAAPVTLEKVHVLLRKHAASAEARLSATRP